MPGSIVLKMGDVSISITAGPSIKSWKTSPAYLPFISIDEPDIRLNLMRGTPQNGDAQKFFGSYPIWDLYRANGNSIIKFYDDMPGLSRSLVFENHLKEADLYFPNSTDQFIHPFYGPVLELLMINYLARKRGTIIHSCGIKYRDKGILFVGESGAGKSTLTRLWNPADDVVILSDDRTIIRKKDGDYWIYGTPWHGEAQFGSPLSVRLDRIYFIQHGAANLARQMSGAEPVQNLLTCSFPPYWDTEGMEFTMDFFSDLTASVQCQELLFKPDGDVVDYVKSHDRLQELPGKIADKKIMAHGSRPTTQGQNAKGLAHGA
jgi:hypothetical protein